MKKVLICCIAAVFLGAGLFAQESDDSDFDEFASLFEDVEDIEVESGAEGEASTDSAVLQQTIIYSNGNIHFSGSTSAKLGALVNYNASGISAEDPRKFDPSPAMALSTSLSLSARINSTTAVYTNFSAGFPGSLQFSCGSFYFDYLILDRVYLTAGKKSTSWGNSRIFSGANSFIKSDDSSLTDEDLETIELIQKQGFLYTNVLYDSGNGISALFRAPTNRGEISFIGFTKDLTAASFENAKKINLAASYEVAVGSANLTFFGRSYGMIDTNTSGALPVLGMEQKSTVWGYDVYAQEVGRFDKSTHKFLNYVFTAGFYRLWDASIPHFGLNIEVQDAWVPLQNTHNFRIGMDAGLKRLGKKQDTKIGLSGNHNFLDDTGTVTLAIIKSNIMPYVDWQTGFTVNYNTAGKTRDEIFPTGTAATTLSLSLSY